MEMRNFPTLGDHEQPPPAGPISGLRSWNLRATWGLALAILFAAIVVYSARFPLVFLAVFVLFWWALLYGIFSGGLLVWRLVTENPSEKPLWNRLATISTAVGLFFATFAVFSNF